MALSHNLAEELNTESAYERLSRFIEGQQKRRQPEADLKEFEEKLRKVFAEAEREVMAEELSKYDLDVPEIKIEGIVHRRVLRCEEDYTGVSGTIRVKRTLYSTRKDKEAAICPMELRAGIVEGHWTPWAAQQAVWVAAHMTPQEGEELFGRLGAMSPSKSSLDRLPKKVSKGWEQKREEFEEALRKEEEIPAAAVTLACSLDGVMAPMKDGKKKEKRQEGKVAGKQEGGPTGYQEVGCGTVMYYDKEGELLKALRIGRMPEKGKETLKEMLTAELLHALEQRPDLQLHKLADGAKDNWEFLDKVLPHKGLPPGKSCLDFYHAAEHLKKALNAACGEQSVKGEAQFTKLRHVLLEDINGAEKVIRSLRHLHKQHPRSKVIKTELSYFRKQRPRMRYAELKAQKLPIGSGVVEAACKTLVTQRMKRSGMRWRERGGQAILTFRGLTQSDRFDAAWELLAATYKKVIALPKKVVPFRGVI